jgi:hypothetical protein
MDLTGDLVDQIDTARHRFDGLAEPPRLLFRADKRPA